MQSPEILLQDLNVALRELYGACQLFNDERLKAEMPVVMRRLLLAEVLGETSILAIGGSQGAGKTTLLCSLYGLDGADSKWLEPNEGRGEKLPILVLEDPSIERAQGILRRLTLKEGQYRVEEDKIDKVENFQKAVSDPGLDVLLPVLKVPQRYFATSNQAWLLLPGYEPQKRDNKTWQELMRQALVGATGCVIVTDETRMANDEQVQIVNDMMANELRGTQALIVISKTEAARHNPARLQELRATAGKVFKVAPDAIDRWVLCTGADDNTYIDEWMPRMREAIEDLARSRGGDRKAQLSRLEAVLSRDLTTVLGLIANKTKLLYQQREGGDEGANEVVLNCLQAFDEARDELREQYQDALAEFLDSRFENAWKTLQTRLNDDHEGVINGIKDFFRNATSSQTRFERDIDGSWGTPSSMLEQYAASIGKLTQRTLGAPDLAQAKDAVQVSGPVAQKLGYIGEGRQLLAWKRPSEEDQNNLRLVLGGRKPVAAGQAQRTSQELEHSVKLLPVLALEYARVSSLLPALVGVNPTSLKVQSVAERPDMMRQAVDQLGDGVALGQTVLRTIATILTVDVVSDGDVDVIPAFLNIFSSSANDTSTAGTVGTTSTAGAAAVGGIGAAIVGVVAVGYLTYSAMRATRLHDEKARVIAHAMLTNVKEHHQRHFVRHFDQLMDQLRNRLRQSLRERYRLDEHLMEKDRLAKSYADVRAHQRDLLDHIGRSGRSLALFDVDLAA